MSSLRYPKVGGVTKLSELTIDADKDWLNYKIKNAILQPCKIPSCKLYSHFTAKSTITIDANTSYVTDNSGAVSKTADYIQLNVGITNGTDARVSYNLGDAVNSFLVPTVEVVQNQGKSYLLLLTGQYDNSSSGVGVLCNWTAGTVEIIADSNGAFTTLASESSSVTSYTNLKFYITTEYGQYTGHLEIDGTEVLSADLTDYLTPDILANLKYFQLHSWGGTANDKIHRYHFNYTLTSVEEYTDIESFEV